MAREINLVPSSKFETIKAIRLRNFIFFLCIAVAGGAIAVVFVLGTIVGGQSIALSGKDNMLKLYSEKINSYSELTDFLTIKDQLGKIQSLSDNKMLLSRAFNLLPVFIPTNGDKVSFSKVELSMEDGSLKVQAQADAMTEPYIDYNVLDAFKKSMDYYRYDYGTYVNELGDAIPSYCIIENDPTTGNFFSEDGKYYAYWTAKVDGCDPRHPVDLLEDDEVIADGEDVDDNEENVENGESEEEKEMEYSFELYSGIEVVKIWRTPLFDEWYTSEYMGLDGIISGIPHFESNCFVYDGTFDEESETVYFTEKNDSCLLVDGGVSGFQIENSGNARDQDQELILSFDGVIKVSTEFFKMQNTHMMAIGINRRYNVTDSFIQVQSMFVLPAVECDEDDIECRNGGK